MKQSLHLVIIGILLVIAAVAVDAWIGARGDSAKLAATLSTQKVAIEQAVNQEHDRDKILAAAVAAIGAEKRRVQTPQQAAKALPLDLPELPLPIPTQAPDVSLLKPATETQSEPLTIPSGDIKPLYDHLEDCRICTLDRDTAQKDLADQQERNAALTKERDAAINASKGGSFWVRVRRAAKWLTIGLVVGASAAALSHRGY